MRPCAITIIFALTDGPIPLAEHRYPLEIKLPLFVVEIQIEEHFFGIHAFRVSYSYINFATFIKFLNI